MSPEPGASPVDACRQALASGLTRPRAAAARVALARALASDGRYADAVEAYRDAVRSEPDDAATRRRLGEALLNLAGDAAAAVDELQAALRLDPRDAQAYGALGAALSLRGEQPEAAAAFAEAVRLDPEYLSAHPAARAMAEAAARGEAWPPPAH